MVTTDSPQFSEECNAWRAALRSQREEFTRMKNELQQAATQITSIDALKDVEHYENQFNIQLTNIHHLKQSIRYHNKVPVFQTMPNDGPPPETMVSDYEKLSAEYQHLRHTLHQIKNDFQRFLVNYT